MLGESESLVGGSGFSELGIRQVRSRKKSTVENDFYWLTMGGDRKAIKIDDVRREFYLHLTEK